MDLRWAKDEDQLDLQDPRFADAVADIGSALRGVPKDELASEEVKQHRRTVRTAWAVGFGLAALAALAGVLAVQSSNNAAEAERQADAAQVNADEATLQAEIASENAQEADRQARVAAEQAELANSNAQVATENAQVASARELAASAVAVRDADPELSVLLALEASQIDASPETLRVLHQAVQSSRTLDSVAQPFLAVAQFAAIAPGARSVVSIDPDGWIWSTSLGSDQEFQEAARLFQVPLTESTRPSLAVAPSGDYIAAIHGDPAAASAPRAKLTIWDTAGSQIAHEVVLAGIDEPQVGFDQEGDTVLAVSRESSRGIAHTQVYDMDARVLSPSIAVEVSNDIRLFPDGTRALHHTFARGVVSVIDFEEGNVTELFVHGDATTGARISPDGQTVAVAGRNGAIALYDMASGQVKEHLNEAGPPSATLEFNANGQRLLVGDHEGGITIYNTETGRVFGELRGHRSEVRSLAWLDGETRVMSAALDAIRLWDVGSEALGEGVALDLSDAHQIRHVAVGGERVYVLLRSDGRGPGPMLGLDGDLSSTELRIEDLWGRGIGLSPDGSLLAAMLPNNVDEGLQEGLEMATGLVRLYDTATGAEVGALDPLCGSAFEEADPEIAAACESPRDRVHHKPTVGLSFSPDGRLLAVAGGALTLSDTQTGSLVAATGFGASHQVSGFVDNGRLLVADQEFPPRLLLLDVDDLSVVHAFDLPSPSFYLSAISPDEALIATTSGPTVTVTDWRAGEVSSLAGHQANLQGVAFSPDGSLLASVDAGGEVIIWDTETLSEQKRIPYVGPLPTGIVFLSDEELLITTDNADLVTLRITDEGLFGLAAERVTRGFTAEECARYLTDGSAPCR